MPTVRDSPSHLAAGVVVQGAAAIAWKRDCCPRSPALLSSMQARASVPADRVHARGAARTAACRPLRARPRHRRRARSEAGA
jgi:hypothetical protein